MWESGTPLLERPCGPRLWCCRVALPGRSRVLLWLMESSSSTLQPEPNKNTKHSGELFAERLEDWESTLYAQLIPGGAGAGTTNLMRQELNRHFCGNPQLLRDLLRDQSYEVWPEQTITRTEQNTPEQELFSR
jgi:hypothetical protein